jgi:hypothetical protein
LRDQAAKRVEALINDWLKSGYRRVDYFERRTVGRAVGHLVRSRLNVLLSLD